MYNNWKSVKVNLYCRLERIKESINNWDGKNWGNCPDQLQKDDRIENMEEMEG